MDLIPNADRRHPAYVEFLEQVVAAQKDRVAVLLTQIEALQAHVVAQDARIVAQDVRIEELERRLASTSRTSSKPPSSDGFSKPPSPPKKPGSRRNPGKQPGSKGSHLPMVADPDEVIWHRPSHCSGCGDALADAEVVGCEVRQVFDVPPVRVFVTEHRRADVRCGCGTISGAAFPTAVTVSAQYGANLRSLAVYLCTFQHLPYGRAAELLSDWFGIPVSPGTLVNIVAEGSALVEPALEVIRQQLVAAPVVHADETGSRVEAKLHWVHSASTPALTLYTAHAKRGRDAMNDAGVIPSFTGILVHDGWAPYRSYGMDHALCNAHHLRELLGAAEYRGQRWAGAMIKVLLGLKDEVDTARSHRAQALNPERLRHWLDRYEAALITGDRNNAVLPQRKPVNLLRRLRAHRYDVLRFATDFRVPFDNNLAERDIRMIKLQQKISGSHRSFAGADRFCRLRSYISTARKQQHNVATALRQLFEGDLWIPAPTPVAPT
jgi:transposase